MTLTPDGEIIDL